MLFRLGYRNLLRNKRRTLLTMGAMTTATSLVILMLGINEGMFWDMIEGATELYHGHAKVTASGYLDDRKIQLTIPQDHPAASEARSTSSGVAPRLKGFALLSFGDGQDMESQPAELFGIDPAQERLVTILHTKVVDGDFLSGARSRDVVIGRGLARRLNASVGGELAAMGMAADGSIAQEMFRIAGVIDTGDPARDALLAVVSLETLQRFLVLEGQVHEFAVRLDRPLASTEWAATMAERFPDTDIVPWQKVLPVIAQYLDIWDEAQLIMSLIFYFAVILVTANTMTMSFFERIREFAVMGAIGLRPARLSRLIILEGAILSTVAAVIGGVLGASLSIYLFYNHIDLSGSMSTISWGGTTMQPRLRSYPTAQNILLPVGLILVLGIVVSFFPAFRLRRLRPVQALSEV